MNGSGSWILGTGRLNSNGEESVIGGFGGKTRVVSKGDTAVVAPSSWFIRDRQSNATVGTTQKRMRFPFRPPLLTLDLHFRLQPKLSVYLSSLVTFAPEWHNGFG